MDTSIETDVTPVFSDSPVVDTSDRSETIEHGTATFDSEDVSAPTESGTSLPHS